MSNLHGKQIVVTSGGTREYIDDVRVVTNISTGALGAKIAAELCFGGANVYYIHSVNARMPIVDEDVGGTITHYPIKTCNDLLNTMKIIIETVKPTAVIHSAAVSDFTFKKDGEVKLSSESSEDFIEYMRQTIIKNPKIIQHIKEWDASTILIGFKFTVGKTKKELLDIAYESGLKNKCDAVFANDKSMMNLYKSHVGFLIDMKKYKEEKNNILTLLGKKSISYNIASYIEEKIESNKRGI